MFRVLLKHSNRQPSHRCSQHSSTRAAAGLKAKAPSMKTRKEANSGLLLAGPTALIIALSTPGESQLVAVGRPTQVTSGPQGTHPLSAPEAV